MARKFLVHCGMGFNRSDLVAGLLLTHLEMKESGCRDASEGKRPGAVFNENFAAYVTALRPTSLHRACPRTVYDGGTRR